MTHNGKDAGSGSTLGGVGKFKDALERALSEGEGEWVDFKSQPYRLETDKDKAKFIKDVLALSNMVQDPGSRCYIFVGVKRDPLGHSHEFPGVVCHDDDGCYQQLVDGWTNPRPRLQYRSFQYRGVSLGVFELRGNADLPYVAVQCVCPSRSQQGDSVRNPLLVKGIVYIRRGSTNDIATPTEIAEIVQRREKWLPKTAAQTTRAPRVDVSPEGKDILNAALSAGGGSVHVLETEHLGRWVRAGSANYTDPQVPGLAARYLDALSNLAEGGLVIQDSAKGTLYKLTDHGRSVAEGLRREPVQKLVEYLSGDRGLPTDKRIELLGLLCRRAALARESEVVESASAELADALLASAAWRMPAARELARGPVGEQVLAKVLTPALDSEDPEVRRLGVWILGRQGLSRAANALIAALWDRDEQVRALAFWALESDPPEKARAAMNAVRERLGSRVWDIAGGALEVFGDPSAAEVKQRRLAEEASAQLSQQHERVMTQDGLAKGMPKG